MPRSAYSASAPSCERRRTATVGSVLGAAPVDVGVRDDRAHVVVGLDELQGQQRLARAGAALRCLGRLGKLHRELHGVNRFINSSSRHNVLPKLDGVGLLGSKESGAPSWGLDGWLEDGSPGGNWKGGGG